MSDQARAAVVLATAGVLVAGAITLGASVSGCSSDKDPIYIYIEAGSDVAPGRSSSSSGSAPKNRCGATSDIDTCGECCRDDNPEASEKYATLVVACFCTEGICKTECAESLCQQKLGQAGDPCDLCLKKNNERCGADVNPKCLEDPACYPILECIVESECTTKPQL